jgi:hypothetical protein
MFNLWQGRTAAALHERGIGERSAWARNAAMTFFLHFYEHYFRCRGVVPIWDKHWERAKQQAAKAKRDLSILGSLCKYL